MYKTKIHSMGHMKEQDGLLDERYTAGFRSGGAVIDGGGRICHKCAVKTIREGFSYTCLMPPLNVLCVETEFR